MPIIDICSRDVVTVVRDDTVGQAAKLMRQHHVGDVVVIEEAHGVRKPVGIVTDRDLVVEVLAPELDPDVMTAGDIMAQNVTAVEEHAGIFEVIQLMTAKGVRRLPVVRRNGDLAGIVSLDDLFVLLAKEVGNFSKLLTKEQKNEASRRR